MAFRGVQAGCGAEDGCPAASSKPEVHLVPGPSGSCPKRLGLCQEKLVLRLAPSQSLEPYAASVCHVHCVPHSPDSFHKTFAHKTWPSAEWAVWNIQWLALMGHSRPLPRGVSRTCAFTAGISMPTMAGHYHRTRELLRRAGAYP